MSLQRGDQLGQRVITCSRAEVMLGFEHPGGGPSQHHHAALLTLHPARDLAHPTEQVLDQRTTGARRHRRRRKVFSVISLQLVKSTQKPLNVCHICNHPNHEQIEDMLIRRVPLCDIAAAFDRISPASPRRVLRKDLGSRFCSS
jgi:hypothetical protein